MISKIRAFLMTFFFIVAGLTFSFASTTGTTMVDDAKNMMDNTMNAADTLGNKAENGIDDMKNSITNTVDNMKDDTKTEMNTLESNTNSNYTVARTSSVSNQTFLGLGSTAWTWLIVAVTVVGVVAIVWYYFADNNTISRD